MRNGKQVRRSMLIGWRLRDKHVAVVGGDMEAERRIETALDAGADVTVFTRSPSPAIETAAHRQQIILIGQDRPQNISNFDMVLATISDGELARGLATDCRSAGVPVHVADVRALCDFWFPATYNDGPLQIAVATSGVGPALAIKLRDHLAKQVPSHFKRALSRFADLRSAIKKSDPSDTPTRRMKWLANYAKTSAIETIASLSDSDIADHVETFTNGSGNRLAEVANDQKPLRRGQISLVGGGPGDPDMLTVAAVKALKNADLVLSDRLIPPAILELASGELKVARKIPGRADLAQQELFDWAIEALQSGKHVVRLKIGDPFILGRGGEEIEQYTKAGFPPRIVPGLSSATAAPALAGLSLTQRNVSDKVIITTGRGKNDSEAKLPSYSADQTLVLLMAVGSISDIATKLIARQSYPRYLPVTVVESASLPNEKVTHCKLENLQSQDFARQFAAPAIFVIGHVAGIKDVAKELAHRAPEAQSAQIS